MNEHVLFDNYANKTDIWRLSKFLLLNSNLFGSHPIVLLLNQPHLFSLTQRTFYLSFILQFLKILKYITCKFKYQLVQVISFEYICFTIWHELLPKTEH